MPNPTNPGPDLSRGPVRIGNVVRMAVAERGGPSLGSDDVARWHGLILTLMRCLHVQWGTHPGMVEEALGGDGARSQVGLLRDVARRIGIEGNVTTYTRRELRRIGVWLAVHVDAKRTIHEHYPDGWREDLAVVRDTTAPQREPEPEPEPECTREPGDDADEEPPT